MTEQDKPKRDKSKSDKPIAENTDSAVESGRIAKILARVGVASRREIERLIEAGDVDPGAARVAEQAGVGLRTVFRHFEDMGGLYAQVTERLEAEILPIVMTPWASSEWRGRLRELGARRAGIYERILPFKVAANLRRFQSDWLMAAYKRFLTMERSGLAGILPPAIRDDVELFSALEMATAFVNSQTRYVSAVAFS